ncbi:MAG: hypothetical protein M1548_00540 [Actinobacteria bacterium]|nr:hypothetical protein [Actinomycetota bacterium]
MEGKERLPPAPRLLASRAFMMLCVDHDRYEAHVCDDAGAVYDALVQDGYEDDEGKRRLSWLAKEVLEELSGKEEALKSILFEEI